MKLYEKLAKLQWMAVEISKSGKNDFQKYQYKKFSDIKKAIMIEMEKLKLAILPVGEIKQLQVGTMVSYIMPMAIIDGESQEQHLFEFPFIGKNTDADKASGTAVTYALKYILNLVALLPDESLDPDEEEVTKKVQQTNKKEQDEQQLKNHLLQQIKNLQVQKGTEAVKQILGIDKNETIRKNDFMNKSIKDLEILIDRLEMMEDIK